MTPDPKAKSEEMDREIERLSGAVDKEKTETKVVLDDLKVKLRHNRLLNSAIRASVGAPSDPPILLPNKGK